MNKRIIDTGEFYHIFNHAIEGRNLFDDKDDIARFYQGMDEFNSVKPIGSIYENSFLKQSKPQLGTEGSKLNNINPKLVNIIAYCLNPNHFHIILEQLEDDGISKFMHRLGGGYTKYINSRLGRRGSIFEGVFKSKHVDKKDYLLHLSVYVNLNNRAHGLDKIPLGTEGSKWMESRSSWGEYQSGGVGLCVKDIILEQLGGSDNYKEYAENTIDDIVERKEELGFEY